MSETKSFGKAYNALPPKLRRKVRKNLVNKVFMCAKDQTFYAKKNGKVGVSAYEWIGIKKEFSKYGINAETGEICQTQN